MSDVSASGSISLTAWHAAGTGTVYGPAVVLDRTRPPIWTCVLDGSADGVDDLALPMSTISVRYTAAASGTARITIPAALAVADGVAARPNGSATITYTQGPYSEEVATFAPSELRMDQGALSQTLTVDGAFDSSPRAPLVFTLDQLTYVSISNGAPRFRIAARGAVRPGDTVIYGGSEYTVTETVLTVTEGLTQLEIQT
jgi:hypothetical protein